MADKASIQKRFSADPDRYYKVKLFEEQGFTRTACAECGRFFWALDGRKKCPDHSDDIYSFIGDPPTSKRFDYSEAWVQIADFFKKNGHAQIGRYPVVCRWRDDLYFTIASIVDFQRKAGSKITFEFPSNPLVVPQTCLRFKDMENVGATGRHFSSFCMVGQHSIADSQGYWKDECIDLDYTLLTGPFGIKKEEIVFVEDVWEGGGSFGSSLEYFVRGLELGNAVFTEFQGSIDSPITLDKRIIDMGAGLERFSWITMGTPTAYDCCFGPSITKLLDGIGCDLQDPKLVAYFTGIAKNIDKVGLGEARKIAVLQAGLDPNRLQKTIAPIEDAYTVADHIRTLVFAISDGALPSNVGGGYNLRMILRRAVAAAARIGIGRDFSWLYLFDAHQNISQSVSRTCSNAQCSGYVFERYSVCASTIHEKSRPMPILAAAATARLRIIRRLYPPPTLLGSAPSDIANTRVLMWSATVYASSMGAIVFCSLFGSSPACKTAILRASPSPTLSMFFAMPVKYATSFGSCKSHPIPSNNFVIDGPKQQSYAVGVPIVIHENLSRPAPMSIIRLSKVIGESMLP